MIVVDNSSPLWGQQLGTDLDGVLTQQHKRLTVAQSNITTNTASITSVNSTLSVSAGQFLGRQNLDGPGTVLPLSFNNLAQGFNINPTAANTKQYQGVSWGQFGGVVDGTGYLGANGYYDEATAAWRVAYTHASLGYGLINVRASGAYWAGIAGSVTGDAAITPTFNKLWSQADFNYTPANKAGDTFAGAVILSSGNLTLSTGQIWGSNGTNALPSHSFGNDSTTGMYLVSGSNLGLAAGGVKIVQISNTGATVSGTLQATGNISTSAGTISAAGDISSTGGVLIAGIAGSLFGGAGGSISAPSLSNTNILLYNNSSANWAGIGADTGGAMYFRTGTASDHVLILDSSGNLAPGADNVNACGGPSNRWGTVYAGNGTINTSDIRLKDNFAPINALAIAHQIDVRAFDIYGGNFKDGRVVKGDREHRTIGVVAQQVRAAMPEYGGIVNGDEDKEILGIYESKMGVLALAAVKELLQTVDALSRRVAELEAIKG